MEPDDRLAPEDRVPPEARLDFFGVALAVRLARVPLEAAAARVWPLVEPELRPESLDVLLALPRAVVAALRELAPLALLLVVLRLVCLRVLLLVAISPPFPGLTKRYPSPAAGNPCNVALHAAWAEGSHRVGWAG